MVVQRIEAGIRTVTLGEAIELAQALNVPPDDMLLAERLTMTEQVHVD